jgi:hypothetical protein
MLVMRHIVEIRKGLAIERRCVSEGYVWCQGYGLERGM